MMHYPYYGVAMGQLTPSLADIEGQDGIELAS